MWHILVFGVTVTVAAIIDSNFWDTEVPQFLSVFKYTKLWNATDYRNSTSGYNDACYHQQRSFPRVFKGIPGEYREVSLSNLKEGTFAVQNLYSSHSGSIPILFHTRWQPVNATEVLESLDNVNGIDILNATFSSTLRNKVSGSCSGREIVFVANEWCKWAQIFSHRQIKGLPGYNEKGKCVVQRRHLAQHYLNMWKTGNKAVNQSRCYGETKGECENKDDEDKCLDQVFMANGKGTIRKMVLKKYQDKITKLDYIDVNMIINFDNWTEDFPRMFSYSYRECRYLGEISQLSMHYFAKARKDRKPPAQFYAFLVIAFFLGVVVMIALLLVICTCSTQSFRLELWDFWIKRKAYMKYAKEHASEIAEQAADKRMEKQEALMGGMLGNI